MLDRADLLAIAAMAVATYCTRIAGMLLGRHLPKTGRAKQAMDALPPAVLSAVIAPLVIAGPAEAIAGVVTVLSALRLPVLAALAIGMACVAGLRAVL